ncbi:MAG TPA: SagB/ThcOx family dehydrogenase [Candidatus Saccharicenans sp.]|nr:SagB/ThcOx family dehydrogenase [Candidatus Saccharicenans sp.]HQO75160.1 SagB/ThcOx family dehydrogenase [Candidatus Saccharicenans sp.]HUM79219.1 SagB/ThcOx family dehydrogenase [Candidatus Saccharicenans sp.]
MKRRDFLGSAVAVMPLLAVVKISDQVGFAGQLENIELEKGEKHMENRSAVKELKVIDLPAPEKTGGKTVVEALWLRRTVRDIKPDALPLQTLSNLLWAAYGLNRPAGTMMRGKAGRTAASASNSQEIDLYVARPDGVYLYEPVKHQLQPVAAGDFRPLAGRRQGGANAPVRIFFVVDLSRYVLEGQPDSRIKDPEVQKSYYYVATGLIAQNIYLYAAANGLAAWFHNCDRDDTEKAFKLRPEQKVLFAMTAGQPAASETGHRP